MALLFTLSHHLVRDVLADELPPPQHHSLWHALCSHAATQQHPRPRPELPAPPLQPQQRWLLEKGLHQC